LRWSEANWTPILEDELHILPDPHLAAIALKRGKLVVGARDSVSELPLVQLAGGGPVVRSDEVPVVAPNELVSCVAEQVQRNGIDIGEAAAIVSPLDDVGCLVQQVFVALMDGAELHLSHRSHRHVIEQDAVFQSPCTRSILGDTQAAHHVGFRQEQRYTQIRDNANLVNHWTVVEGGSLRASITTSGAADVTTCLDNECESGMIRDDAHGSDNPMLLFMNSRRSSRSDSTPIDA